MRVIAIPQPQFDTLAAIGKLMSSKADSPQDLGVLRAAFYRAQMQAEISVEQALEIVNDNRTP
jgi:hypothetical protein